MAIVCNHPFAFLGKGSCPLGIALKNEPPNVLTVVGIILHIHSIRVHHHVLHLHELLAHIVGIHLSRHLLLVLLAVNATSMLLTSVL